MNRIYYNSPIFLQHLFTSIYGYKLKKKRYNSIYKESLLKYVKGDCDTQNLLYKLLNHLKNNIKFYENIEIDRTELVESLRKIPFTSKEDLRQELNLRSCLEADVTIGKTGGTTGKSLKVYSSEYDKANRMAYLDYIKFINGVEPFSKRASFTGKEITPINDKNVLWRYNITMNQILYASFKLNPENVKYVFANMQKNKPIAIDGFPSSIHLVAKYILSNNIKVDWNVEAVFPTAETLNSNVKTDIEKAFNTKVIDQYASSEGAPFLYTIADGSYKIGNETGVFEFYKVESNIYEMIVTSLINYATPIVRYKIGDRVEINSDEEYLNSLTSDIKISRILGRNSDYLTGSEGNIVTSVNIANIVKNLDDKIIQSQFIQKGYNNYIVKLVVNDKYQGKKDEKTIIEMLNHRLGYNNYYIFQYLSIIPKEKSGKTRFIINEMSET